LGRSGQPRQALAQYVQVQGELQKFPENLPGLEPENCQLRLGINLMEKIAEVTAETSRGPRNKTGRPSPGIAAPGAAASNHARRFGVRSSARA